MFARENVTAFDADGGGGGECNRSRVTEEFHGGKVDLWRQAQSVEQQLAVRLADLMREDFVDVGSLPVQFTLELFPSRAGKCDARM